MSWSRSLYFSLTVVLTTGYALAGDTTSTEHTGALPTSWNCPYRIVTDLPGIAQPLQQVTLSTALEGAIAHIYVTESSYVSEGELVAALDTRALKVDLALAEAALGRTSEVDRVKQEVQLAEQNLARTKELKEKGASSAARLDQDEAVAAVARSQLAEANERKQEAKLRLNAVLAAIELRSVRAPFDGRVIRVEGHVGQTIRLAEPIVSLVNLERLVVDLYLPSNRINDVRSGEHYNLWAAAPINKLVTAELMSKEPIVNAGTGTFRCRFEIDNRTSRFPAGFAVGMIDLDDKVSATRESAEHLKVTHVHPFRESRKNSDSEP